jgi:photosystem II stability/assembly factor-like uncharacterized protein
VEKLGKEILKKRVTNLLRVVASISIAFIAHAQAGKPASVPYNWKSVQIVGGGFVDGIVFHPTAKDVRYARTDIGGAYRWSAQNKRWESMLDWISHEDSNLMGIESIAVDPSDPGRLYLACGTYTNPRAPNGAILWSNYRGKTFHRADLPFKFGGNENGRGNGERLAVDPNDGRLVYLGTRDAGLWRSNDRGVTWKKVENFPDATETPVLPAQPVPGRPNRPIRGSGIVFVIFDPGSGSKGKRSSAIYVGVSLMGRDNLFRSSDGGDTWKPLPGEPTQYRPTRAALASDGALYVAYGSDPGPRRMTSGGVWKLDTDNGEWTDITPDKPGPEKEFGYAAVSVDAHNPKVVIASSFGRPWKAGSEDIFRSIDGGRSWKPVLGGGGTYDPSLAPYVAVTPIHWLFDIEIDPLNPDHAVFTTGYGGWETFNLSDVDSGKPARWSVMSTGIEETVALELLSPPEGAHLISAIGDYGGFTHWDLDKPAPEGSSSPPRFGNTSSAAFAWKKPEVVVRVGITAGGVPGGTPHSNIGYSLDGGKAWQPAASSPAQNSRMGSIAVSSDGATWVWTPEAAAASFTVDRGKTWSQSKGLPERVRVIADAVNPHKFYAIDLFGGNLFLSTDNASSFEEKPLSLPDGLPKPGGNRGDRRGGQDRIYATPGREGDLWLAAFNGLYHSSGTEYKFSKVNDIEELHAFGFGKAAKAVGYPALYLVGTVNGVHGIFRSDDMARSWVRINDDQHQWGLILQITGDPRQYGRVYVGTHGRGILYGDPAAKR